MQVRRLLSTFLLLTLLLASVTLWLASPASAVVIQVPGDYPTIQEAVDAAGSGDTIQVAAGTYYENVLVTTSVVIVGDSATTTIVDGGGSDIVFNIQADNVELRQLTIRNGGTYSGVLIYYPYSALTVANCRIRDNVVGIAISEADGNTIQDSIVVDNAMYGVNLHLSSGNIIKDNQIMGSAYGIEVSDSSNSQVANNTFSATSYGVYTPYSNNINISANTFTGNSWNIYLTHSDSNTIGYNDVSGGTVGIQIMYSQDNQVFNNTSTDISYGIYLGYCGGNTVSGNRLSQTDWGIELYNSSGSILKENNVISGTWGFYVAEHSLGNRFYHNNLLNNVKQVFQDITSGSNSWRTPTTPIEGNHWSNYPGQDTNGDGVGDTYIPWEGVDYYPLMAPWGGFRNVAIIDVTASATQVYIDDFVYVNVTAKNQGTWMESFNVTARYENTSLGISGTLGTQEVTNLTAGTSILLMYSWNTTGVQPCVYYTIIANASTVPNELDTSDNTYSDGRVKVKIHGDVNGDGVVDISDLSTVSMAYGTFEGQPGYNPVADLNKDGIVDSRDIAIVTINWGNSCL